jgi:putative endonuclease
MSETNMIQKPWFLYVIECQDNSLYTGVAVDVAARYAMHESGKGARYTRSHRPKQLLAVMEYPDRSAALKAECAFKKLKSACKRIYLQENFKCL